MAKQPNPEASQHPESVRGMGGGKILSPVQFHVVWEEWSDPERGHQLQVPQNLHRGKSGCLNSEDWETQPDDTNIPFLG